jgi:Arc/MetJ-type ribon-helix-helix transcriptional regulator
MARAVQVTEGTDSKIEALVASGRFASREAVVEAAVDQVAAGDPWLHMVDAKVAEARAEFDAGRSLSGDALRDDLHARYRTRPA